MEKQHREAGAVFIVGHFFGFLLKHRKYAAAAAAPNPPRVMTAIKTPLGPLAFLHSRGAGWLWTPGASPRESRALELVSFPFVRLNSWQECCPVPSWGASVAPAVGWAMVGFPSCWLVGLTVWLAVGSVVFVSVGFTVGIMLRRLLPDRAASHKQRQHTDKANKPFHKHTPFKKHTPWGVPKKCVPNCCNTKHHLSA